MKANPARGRLCVVVGVLGAAAGCNHMVLRGDIGGTTKHAYVSSAASGGIGVGAWNQHGRVALNAMYAHRPAADAVLVEAEGQWFFRHRGPERFVQAGYETNEEAFSAWALTARVAAGPAVDDATLAIEGSIGIGIVGHSRFYDEAADRRWRHFGAMGLEAFVTRTHGVQREPWVIGARLSMTLPGNIFGFVLDVFRRKPV